MIDAKNRRNWRNKLLFLVSDTEGTFYYYSTINKNSINYLGTLSLTTTKKRKRGSLSFHTDRKEELITQQQQEAISLLFFF